MEALFSIALHEWLPIRRVTFVSTLRIFDRDSSGANVGSSAASAAGCLNAKGAFDTNVFTRSALREVARERKMPIGARTHCARVCSRFPALEGIVGGRNGAAKHRGGGNLARNDYATSSMPRTATETEAPEKEIAKIES